MLEYGKVYYEDLDSAEQRAALLEFYSSTGGADWTEQLVSTPERDQFQLLVQELEEAGYDLAEQAVNTSLLSTDLVTDLANLPALSANCMLQQWLSFGQLLLKYEWGSNVSYCRWYGVLCCKTSVHPFSVVCSCDLSSCAVFSTTHQLYARLLAASEQHVQLQGDLLNQYCSGPQSVASLTLSGMHLH